jgi:hypothetical protein
MADDADNDLLQLRIGKIKNPVIADTDAKAIAIFQLFATVRERIFLQCDDGFGDARLNLRWKPFKFLACVARDFNLPAHTRMFSSFNVWRKDWRG